MRVQVAYSLVDRRPQLLMAEYCQNHGIAVLPYGVLAGGFIADKYQGVPAAK
jgi:aryl-alcohol dehydrogenase-like predicted oxidoreductase